MSNVEDEFLDENEQQEQEGQLDDGDEVEQRARKQGWRPESEWDEARAEREGRRKPAKFFTAKEFLDRNETNMPILRERLRKTEDRLELADRDVKELKVMVMEQRKMGKEAAARAHAEGRSELEAELRNAFSSGDLDKHDEIIKKIGELDKAERETILEDAKRETQTVEVDPKVRAATETTKTWVAKNAWFTDIKKAHLNAAMIHEHNLVKNREPDMEEWEGLEEAKRIVMQRYPEEFGQRGPRSRLSTVETPSNRGAGSGANSVEARFQALPKADRDVFLNHQAKFKKQNVEYTKAEFLADYNN